MNIITVKFLYSFIYLPDPGIEPWSPALQADSLPFKLQGSPLIMLSGEIKWAF